VNLDGEIIQHLPGPIIFGQEGSEGQHAYHQFLHQGTLCIPMDFILVGKPHPKHDGHHHQMLLASALSQAEALMQGLSLEAIQAKHPSLSTAEAAHRVLPGNRPSNILLLDELTPFTLGALLSLYEHKIFASSVLAEVNPFDQWGVELGKQLLPDILSALEAPNTPHDTPSLLTHLKKLRNS
jgi:glucose-6-phosphate isomerase